MYLSCTYRAGAWAGLVAALSTTYLACGEELTCVDSRSCPSPSATPDGSNAGGSSASGGGTSTGGSAGSAGTVGSSGTAGVAVDGSAGVAGDGAPPSDASSDAASCNSEKPDVARGVFVSSTGQDGAEGSVCGSPQSPCQTLGKALSIAAEGYTVYVAAGVYEEDGIRLKAGVTLQGAWRLAAGGVWSRVCTSDRSSAVVVRPRTADRTLSAVDLGGMATVEALTLRSKTALSTAGQSLYGIFATGGTTEIALSEVVIEVGAAGAGAPGGVGQEGTAPAANCAAGTGADGAQAGGSGAGAPSGTFSADGYFAAPGVVGGEGSNGSNGTAAPSPPCIICPNTGAACELYCEGDPCPIRCRWSSGVPSCGSAGSNGCGGGGGRGGLPGRGGGSSVGVFLWNATLRANSGRISSGKGGDGGPGGAAGRGKVGSAGTPGSIGSSCSICEATLPVGSCGTSSATPGAGSPGGNAGAGRDGGPGGGGSGGHSYAVYAGGAAVANVLPAVELVPGSAGVGAGTAAGRGSDGNSAPVAP